MPAPQIRTATRVSAFLALGLTASSALAQPGQVSGTLTCQTARQIVASRGAVVLSTGPRTYDRYVSSSQFCVLGETTEPAWIPTADTRQCFVGYRCRETDIEVFGR